MEFWRDIKGYEGLYQISNYGRVKSLERYVKHYKGGVRLKKEIILEPVIVCGYFKVNLYKENILKQFSIHRLVAQAFIPNPDNLPEVNHKDENKQNNNATNLEWVNDKYNTNYGTRNKRVSDKMTNGKLSIPVLQYDLDGNFIKEWPSISEVRRLNNFHKYCIIQVCKNKQESAYGYKWKYK